MGFDPQMRYGAPVPTTRDTEQVIVQLVQLTANDGVSNAKLVVDLHPLSNGRPVRGRGIMFNDAQALRDLALALIQAADDAEAKGMGTPPAAAAPEDDDVPVMAIDPTQLKGSLAKLAARKVATPNGPAKKVAAARKTTARRAVK